MWSLQVENAVVETRWFPGQLVTVDADEGATDAPARMHRASQSQTEQCSTGNGYVAGGSLTRDGRAALGRRGDGAGRTPRGEGRGHRLVLDRCKPITGSTSDCIEAIEEYRDAGCTHVMLELSGENRHRQLEVFGQQVLPHFRQVGSRS